MSDYLVQIASNPQARKLIQSLGLPIPLPEKLRRAPHPWEDRPLHDRVVVVGAAPGAALHPVLARTLAPAGATPWVVGDEAATTHYSAPGEAYGRPAVALKPGEIPEHARVDGLVFDATGLTAPGDLRAVYDFFHPWMRALGRSGRIVVLGRPPEAQADAEAAAAAAALDGFVRSAAKEIGKRGATAQLVTIEPGAEDRAGPVVRFLLSPRSAFVSGQPLRVTTLAQGELVDRRTRPLDGKVALVTGAARGIGAETARLMAAEGAHVICLDRPADDGPASAVAREIGGSLHLVDVTDPEAPRTLCEAIEADFGGLDVVVHNAGVTRDKTLARMKPDWWEQAVEVNLTAVTRITSRLTAGVLRDGGRIICLSSIAGIAGNFGQTNYAASKAGVIGYVRALAPTLAPRGITVNAVAPGFIETRLTDAMPVVVREVARRLNNLSQGGVPRDVAEVITFLATPGAIGVTGGVLRVCGGNLVGA